MYEVRNGDSRDLLLTLEDASVDGIVTDPPYEIGFLGKGWDLSGVAYDVEFWKQCLRVLKPGGHLIAFSAARTYHRMACAIEDAGFEIRDQLMWLYSQGMPKGQNIEKQAIKKGLPSEALQGWNTTLKPSHEPIVMARKALEGTVLDNMVQHGVGGLNIEVCRVPTDWANDPSNRALGSGYWNQGYVPKNIRVPVMTGSPKPESFDMTKDRFPANVLHDGSEVVLCHFPDTTSGVLKKGSTKARDFKVGDVDRSRKGGRPPLEFSTIGDSGSAARFFYCAKPMNKERDAGLESFEASETWAMQNNFTSDPRMENPQQRLPKKNTHVTVKPTKLMQWLVRLVVPQGALVLDPFTGSGSTGRGCMLENIRFLGFELSEEYCSIATARIEDAMLEYLRSQENHEAPSLFGDDTHEDEDDET